MVCCLSLLLLAPLQTVANFALASLPAPCEEHPPEKAGAEHEAQLSHLVRRQWLSARRPALLLPARALSQFGTPRHPASGGASPFGAARPHEGAGIRARC